jgi:hypothetical protein
MISHPHPILQPASLVEARVVAVAQPPSPFGVSRTLETQCCFRGGRHISVGSKRVPLSQFPNLPFRKIWRLRFEITKLTIAL